MKEMFDRHETVDLTNGVPKRYRHLRGERLEDVCRKLRIRFAGALVGWEDGRPVLDGVVVSSRSAAKVEEAIRVREQRAQERKLRKTAAKERKHGHVERCERLGINPDSHFAELLDRGAIDEDLAELLDFMARYRHEHTDYEGQFDKEDFQRLREYDYSPEEARAAMREDARMAMQEVGELPETWQEYVKKYRFRSAEARALARVLRSPQECHPRWFKEAEIAVRRARLPLDGLTYRSIVQAIEQWRRER